MEKTYSPVAPAKRIDQIDILRGFALFGILMVNVFGYHASFYHFADFYKGLTEPLQQNLYSWMMSFGADKFISIFSLLFGYGLWMLQGKFAGQEKLFTRFYSRRMLSLSLIGLLHILLFWAGDILFIYGILGLLLLSLRRVSTKPLLVLAGFSYFFTVWVLILGNYFPGLPYPLSTTSSISMDEVVSMYSSGGFADILLFRINEYITFRNINLLYYAPKIFALFIIGYILGRHHLLQWLNKQTSKAWFMTFVFLLLGLFFILRLEALINFLSYPDSQNYTAVYIGVYEIGNAFLGGAYLLIILLFCKTRLGLIILNPFKYVGRMALTNYLLQSVIFTTVFYGYGFGLFGSIPPSTFLFWGVLVFVIQLLFSKLWLTKFRYGPMEYVWRRMTYGKGLW